MRRLAAFFIVTSCLSNKSCLPGKKLFAGKSCLPSKSRDRLGKTVCPGFSSPFHLNSWRSCCFQQRVQHSADGLNPFPDEYLIGSSANVHHLESGIAVIIRYRNSAENAVAFSSGDDSYIIIGVSLQIRTLEFLDRCRSCICLCRC